MKNIPHSIWNSKAIRKRLMQEAHFEGSIGQPEKPQYWVNVPLTDTFGETTLRNYNPGIFDSDPHEIQQVFAKVVRKMLQAKYGHDGLWMVGWTHPPATWQQIRVDGDNVWGRMIMLWCDEDADPQFAIEFDDEKFVEMMSKGEAYYVDQAERAWISWDEYFGKKAQKSDLCVSEAQTHKEALSTLG